MSVFFLLDEGDIVFADVNSIVILNCQLNATADSIRWSFSDMQANEHQIQNGRLMNPRFNSTGRFSVNVTSGSSSLTIDPAQPQDSGRYQCYTESTDSPKFFVTVVGTSTIFILL